LLLFLSEPFDDFDTKQTPSWSPSKMTARNDFTIRRTAGDDPGSKAIRTLCSRTQATLNSQWEKSLAPPQETEA
jgi:hypothetical protein